MVPHSHAAIVFTFIRKVSSMSSKCGPESVPKIYQKAVSNGNLRFWTRYGESAQSLSVVLAPDRCMGGRMPAESGPNGVVTQARVAYRGHQRGTFGASQCFLNPRDFGTIHCRHHFSDIIGWLVTIHVHSSLESGRACT